MRLQLAAIRVRTVKSRKNRLAHGHIQTRGPDFGGAHGRRYVDAGVTDAAPDAGAASASISTSWPGRQPCRRTGSGGNAWRCNHGAANAAAADGGAVAVGELRRADFPRSGLCELEAAALIGEERQATRRDLLSRCRHDGERSHRRALWNAVHRLRS